MEDQGYNPQVLARLRESLGELDRGDLVQILSHVIKVYVIESTAPFRIRLPAAEAGPPDGAQATPGFPRLVRALQEQYRLPELDRFRVEGEEVRLRVDGGEVVFRDGRANFLGAGAGAGAAGSPVPLATPAPPPRLAGDPGPAAGRPRSSPPTSPPPAEPEPPGPRSRTLEID